LRWSVESAMLNWQVFIVGPSPRPETFQLCLARGSQINIK
jgi:hypothetical protein